MALVVTEAIILHAFNYLESSRIFRIATRDAGLQSVLAKGARRSRARFGSALDLFAGGSAQLYVKPGRDLQTLASFDVTRSRPQLAGDITRFTGASMIVELAMRMAGEEPNPELFDAIAAALDGMAGATPQETVQTALACGWRMIAACGFSPTLDSCALCHDTLDPDLASGFSHVSGGALCADCARTIPSRVLPPDARAALRMWIAGAHTAVLPPASGRAHQRLFREFVVAHSGDARPLRAFDVWEQHRWSDA